MLLCAAITVAIGSAPTLSSDAWSAPPGSSLAYTVQGSPAALWVLYGSGAPAEIDLGALGVLRIALAGAFPLGSGFLDGTGAGTLALGVPNDPSLVDQFLYSQAATVDSNGILLSNSIAIRVDESPLTGPRTPVGVAVTPFGSSVLAVLEAESALSIVDPSSGLVREIPVAPIPAAEEPFGQMSVSLAPDGAHAFVATATDEFLTVVDVPSGSVSAKLPVPRSTRRVAFTSLAGVERAYATNDRDEALLEFTLVPPLGWIQTASFPLQGRGPGAIDSDALGRLFIGQRVTREIEVFDPATSQTVTRIPIGGIPKDVEIWATSVYVPAFAPVAPPGTGAARNVVLEISTATLAVSGSHLVDLGTDYLDVAAWFPYLVVAAMGSGTLVVADLASEAPLAVVDLNPPEPPATFAPSANPMQVALEVGDVAALRAYAVDYFRDTIRPVALAGGPPFALEPEIALAHSGQPLVPLLDLSEEANGDWWFRSVQFMNGEPLTPNPVTCYTCHPDGGADGLAATNQRPPLWENGATGPWGSKGASPTLLGVIQGAFGAHSIFGGSIPFGADQQILAFLENANDAPASPFLALGGALNPAQSNGKALFEGAAQCSSCHAAPLFIPTGGNPLTIAGGVGTGLVPANVPSLLGAWATPPYFKNGSAATLLDVVNAPTGNLHGQTSTLTAQQEADLVEYLKTL